MKKSVLDFLVKGHEAEHYDWLKAAAQRAHRTEAATETVIAAVEKAGMDSEHSALDDLLK